MRSIIILKVLAQKTTSTYFGQNLQQRAEIFIFFYLFLKFLKLCFSYLTVPTNHMGVSLSAEYNSVGLGQDLHFKQLMGDPAVAGPRSTL